MAKMKLLVLETGGTIGQEKDKKGVYRPSKKDPIKFVEGIYDLADIDTLRPANIDSTNMETKHRAMLAKLLYKNRLRYDGFVIFHGTDTMADTAAALTYMVQGLGKPVVLTGSQKPIFEPGNDAENNVYHSVEVATKDFGEVVIAFGDKVVRGARAIKVSEQGLNAFDSPRAAPVAEIGLGVIPSAHRIRRFSGDARLFTKLDTYIELYAQPSGTSTDMFCGYVDNPSVHGIVVLGYGAGNVQTRLVEHIERATKKGKPVVVATNCMLGAADMGMYKVGSEPLKAGAISARDMTHVAAIQKLMFAVGRADVEGLQGGERLALIKAIIHQPYGDDISSGEREKALFGHDV